MTVVRFECFNPVAGFGNDTQIAFLIDDVGDTCPEQGVVVHEQDAGGHGRPRGGIS